MPGYGMTDPKAAAAINALAAKNNAANTAIGYKPTTGTQAQAQATAAKARMLSSGASYMPSYNPTAQSSRTVTNQSAGNDDAKRAMLAWGTQFMPSASPGAQATGSVANQFSALNNALNRDTSTGSTWRAMQPGNALGDYIRGLGGGGSSGSSSGGLGSMMGGGGLSSMMGGGGMGGLGSMLGGMGGLGSMGGLGGMGGMGGVGDALGGALGGGTAAEEKEPDKPIPQRHWAGGYTSAQQAAMNSAGDNVKQAKLKQQFDAENVKNFQGMESYDEVKKDRVKQAQALAEGQGGQYDSEGNYYSRDVAKTANEADKKKRAQAEANYYDIPEGAVPVAANEADKKPPGSAGSTSSKDKDKGKGSKSSSLDSDWLKKLAGMASSWFGGG